MSGVNKLMFQVGIEEVERKLSSVRAEYDSFAEKYKDGITIKLKLDEAESLASSLSKIGDPKALMPYLDEIERLKKLLGDAKNAIDFLLSLFYIKPQLQRLRLAVSRIVFYLFSTSNHNQKALEITRRSIVFYLFSTSNHNSNYIAKCWK